MSTSEAYRERVRRTTALRGCDRVLSGIRPASVADQLATMRAAVDPDLLPDLYGEGGAVEAVEGRVADLLGTEAAAFFPTGTMAQQVAVRYGAELTGRTAIGLHPLSHLVVHERDAYAALTGLRAVRTTDAPRNPTAAEVAGLDEPIGTLLLELPLRDAGFVLPSWDELVATAEAARARGARVHLDGARLWESTSYLGHSLAEVAALADSTYVSF
jgi:threonine aldolase